MTSSPSDTRTPGSTSGLSSTSGRGGSSLKDIDQDMRAFWSEVEHGNPSDIQPISTIPPKVAGSTQSSNEGAKEILTVIKLIANAGIPCCLVCEAALKYYGTKRVRHQWDICVPTNQLDTATKVFTNHPDLFTPIPRVEYDAAGGPSHLFPQFKIRGMAVSFDLLSSQACHIPCTVSTIEYSQTGLPYPTLSVYVQSLLETANGVDLEDLVDGMNLKQVWGEENLDLKGGPDVEWARWHSEMLEKPAPDWCDDDKLVRSKQETWDATVAKEAKQRRQGRGMDETHETRFWRKGHVDPRTLRRDWC